MTQPYAFCNYLRGVLDASKNDAGLGAQKTAAVKSKLHSVFEHVIDPSYPQHLQASMQQAHSGQNSSDNNSGVPQQASGRQPPLPSGTGGIFIKC